ncbi:PAS domain S-box protein, partial [Thermodesulfobacteriota bacterium]
MIATPTYEELVQKIKDLENRLTEKDQTESALRASEELYRACFEKAKIPITVIDIETRERVFFNREAHESFGYTESEYKKLKTSELDADESAEEVAAHLMKISSEGSDIFEAMHKTKNGEIRNSLINSVSLPLKDHNYLLSIRVDITDLKKTQKALQENEEKYRSFFEHAGFPIILFDAETGERVDFNRAAYESLGYARDEYQNTKPMDVEQEEGLNEMTEHLKKILKNGSDIFETRHVRKDGEIRETLNSAVGLRIGGRSLIHNIGVDITDRKRAEDALRDSEERYRSLVENIDLGVTLIDSSYNIVMINPTQSRVFSKTEDRIIGKKCYREFNGLDDPCVYCPGTNVLTSGKPEEVEKASVLDDGSQHYVNIKAFPILGPDKSVTGFIEVTEDITEKKRLEIQLQRAQRMEALGTLAGGIAHDFNNLLMGIQGRTSLILSEKANTQSAVDHLKGIEDHIKSATDLTNQLLGFARGGKYEVTSTDLNELIKKQSDMFGRTRKEITINETYSEDLWNINVDKGQIEQVILNLYVNAWHAMPGGGHIYVQTENMILDDNYVKPYEIKPGNYVKISITDT